MKRFFLAVMIILLLAVCTASVADFEETKRAAERGDAELNPET